jgi:hypothetical protein
MFTSNLHICTKCNTIHTFESLIPARITESHGEKWTQYHCPECNSAYDVSTFEFEEYNSIEELESVLLDSGFHLESFDDFDIIQNYFETEETIF